MSDTQAILSELARVKVPFQARAIAAHVGAPSPSILGSELNKDRTAREDWPRK